MPVSLSPETQKLIEDRMKDAGFVSADEFVRAAIFSLDQQDWLRRASTVELEAMYPGIREKIAEGIADAEAGRLTDGEEFFAELEREEQDSEAQRHGRKTA